MFVHTCRSFYEYFDITLAQYWFMFSNHLYVCVREGRVRERETETDRIYIRDQIQDLIHFGEPSVTELCSVCLFGFIFNGDLHCSIILTRTLFVAQICLKTLGQSPYFIFPSAGLQEWAITLNLSYLFLLPYSYQMDTVVFSLNSIDEHNTSWL